MRVSSFVLSFTSDALTVATLTAHTEGARVESIKFVGDDGKLYETSAGSVTVHEGYQGLVLVNNKGEIVADDDPAADNRWHRYGWRKNAVATLMGHAKRACIHAGRKSGGVACLTKKCRYKKSVKAKSAVPPVHLVCGARLLIANYGVSNNPSCPKSFDILQKRDGQKAGIYRQSLAAQILSGD